MSIRLCRCVKALARSAVCVLIAVASTPAFAQDKFQFPLLAQDGYNGTLMPAEDFGSRQIAQMLDDRPDMKGVVAENSKIWQFVREGFNKGDDGKRIYWLGGEFPEKNAFHSPTRDRAPAYIHVPGGKSDSPIDKWGALVFEFHNIKNTPDFYDLYTKASQLELSADQFADDMLKLEFRALRKTKLFFEENNIEGATAGVDFWYWWVQHGDLDNVDAYIARQNDKDPHRPRNIYWAYANEVLEQRLNSLIKIAP